jgi:hypothetical protein
MEILDIQGKVEEAFRRVLQPYSESGDLSTLQLILSFFTGKPQSRRLSVTAANIEAGLTDENGAPVTWQSTVQIEIVTNKKDDGKDHKDMVAIVAEVVYGGRQFCTSLNTAMQGEGFNALFWANDQRRESEQDGTICKTRIFGTLEMQPW